MNGTATEYFLNGSQILAEKTGDTVTWFFYDSRGTRIGMAYGSNLYYYLYNLQGDVTALVRASTGKIAATYSYDAWGNCTVTNAAGYAVGDRNPFRYRGYYYDTETGLYYLQSRYYSPEFGRFISADNAANLGADGEVLSYNLFAYCLNNPINRTDDDGNLSLPNWAKVTIGIVSTVAAVAITVATGGAAAPVLIGVAASTISGAAFGAVNHRITTGSWKGADQAAMNGAADGLMMGGIGALSGAVVSTGVKAVKTARQGITIGRNMAKVNQAAGLTDTLTYSDNALWKPMSKTIYQGISKKVGEAAADKVSCACNKIYIKTMRMLGAVIYDSGLNGAAEAGMYYGMELEALRGYVNVIRMY